MKGRNWKESTSKREEIGLDTEGKQTMMKEALQGRWVP
jgi:hypothetical protein